MITRRAFMGSILALGVAPAVVRASSLMPVRAFGIDFVPFELIDQNKMAAIVAITEELIRFSSPSALDLSVDLKAFNDAFNGRSLRRRLR